MSRIDVLESIIRRGTPRLIREAEAAAQQAAACAGGLLDKRATDACLAFTRDFRPEIRVIAGDLWDFAAIRKGASEDERAKSMRDDFASGAAFARNFFKGGKENHLMLGNHDVRIYDLMESTAGMACWSLAI